MIGIVLLLIHSSGCSEPSGSPPGTILTLAGSSDLLGDGRPATEARLVAPNGVFAAADDTVYFTDGVQSAIRKITPDGRIETLAGTGLPGYTGDGGPALEARLDYPNGLLMDPAGNLYFADEFAHVVRMIDHQGKITTVAGIGTPGYSGDGGHALHAQLSFPRRLALAADGAL